jgi:RNA polymerase sigma-70 factor (ECF subfamily)
VKTNSTSALERPMGAAKSTHPKSDDLSEWMRQGYQEVRRMAAQYFQDERSDHTLQPTALVHEVFIRLHDNGPERYANRAHFYGVVSRAMRQILVDHARGHRAQKRAGAWRKVPLQEADVVALEGSTLLALNAAIEHLKTFDRKLCRIAELRLFAGLSTSEVADVLGRGESTIRRDWHLAKVWLQSELPESR